MSQLATLSSRFLCHLSSSHSFLMVLAAKCCIWFPRSQLCLCYLWVAVVRHGLVLLEVPVASLLCPSVAWSLLRRRLPFHVYYGQCFLCPPKSKNSQIAALSLRFMSHFFSVHSLLTVLAAMCCILASTFAALSLLPLGGGGASWACFVGSSCGKPPLSIGCLVICCSVCHFMSIAFFAPNKELVKMTCAVNMCHNICTNKRTRRHIL